MADCVEQQSNLQSASQSDDEVLVRVENVSKKFCRSLKRSLWYGLQDAATELTGRKSDHELRKDEFWALNNISFELKRGEALGLVGSNGAGKTTLLRIISGLIRPDRGSVTVKGRVAPLIALGAGFNPILTGRENIYANMSILGLSKAEVDEVFNEVVRFAEIGDAIDSPVQSYSSGMAARLGFACAVHVEPDILLIDEVLAVGDIRFKSKCQRKLAELLDKRISFVLVSHTSSGILNTCSKAIYLNKGEIRMKGSAIFVTNKYEEDLLGIEAFKSINAPHFRQRKSEKNSHVKITELFFRDKTGNVVVSNLKTSLQYNLCVICQAEENIEKVNIFVVIHENTAGQEPVLHLSSFYDNHSIELRKGINEVQLRFPYLGLKPGVYTTKIFVKKGSIHVFDSAENFCFTVQPEHNRVHRGLFYQPVTWDVVSNEEISTNRQ